MAARSLAFVLCALVVACAPTAVISQTPVPTETVAPTLSPTATPKPAPIKARSVTAVGRSVAASGDFRGTGATQLAIIQDPNEDLALKITVRDTPGEHQADTLWLATDPNVFSLQRAKFTVADVDFDGRDDLVALYDSGSLTARIYVLRSTGTAFAAPSVWWSGAEFSWARSRAILAGKFGDGHTGIVVAYQADDARLLLQSFTSDGAKLTLAGATYDSGAGKFDLGRMRFAVGHFTRTAPTDEIGALYQSNGRVRVFRFTPSTKGFVLQSDGYETDADYDLRRASIAAADVTGDGRDDLVSLYTADDGSARVHVFDSAAGLKPSNGWNGWAVLDAGSTCAFAGALVLGDWEAAGRVDPIALTPGAAGAMGAYILRNTGAGFTTTKTPVQLRCPVWPLTGLPLTSGDATKRPVYVKTDNNPSARPHYGISKADMVYEWLVEGLTTRLAAVYQSDHPGTIGSVRSVRMTDRHVLPSLDAALVYSGGGPEELMAINYDASVARRYVDLSPGYGWGYRVEFRHAPYNYFTSWDAVQSAIAAAPDATQPAMVAPWRFLPTGDGDALAGGFATSVAATKVEIPYRALFGVSYAYDAASRTYARYQDGVREVDGANNVAIAAKNVVVIQTEVHFTTAFGLDPAGNPKLEEVLTGSGKGVVFRDGRRQDVTWSRNDIIDAFTLRDASGAVVLLAPGQTWIHVVPNDWTIPSS